MTLILLVIIFLLIVSVRSERLFGVQRPMKTFCAVWLSLTRRWSPGLSLYSWSLLFLGKWGEQPSTSDMTVQRMWRHVIDSGIWVATKDSARRGLMSSNFQDVCGGTGLWFQHQGGRGSWVRQRDPVSKTKRSVDSFSANDATVMVSLLSDQH